MLGGMVLLSVGVVWRHHAAVLRIISHPPGHVTPIILQPPPEMPIQHPVVVPPTHRVVTPPPAVVAPPAPTVAVTDPRLVDEVDPSKAMPDISSLNNQQIGASTIKSPGTTGVVAQGGTPGAGAGVGDKGDEPVSDFTRIEKMPAFPGGEEALRRFFMRYLQTPDELEEGGKVRVVIRFVVGKDGSLSAYDISQSGGQVFDAEVVRVLKKMPKWTPGIQNGRPVAVYFNLPVTFMRTGD